MPVDPAKFLRPGTDTCGGCGQQIGWLTVDRVPFAIEPKRTGWIDEAVIVRHGWVLHEDTCPRIDALRKAEANGALKGGRR